MKPLDPFVTVIKGASRFKSTRVVLQMGGDPQAAKEAGRKLAELSRRVKVGRKLGASELLRAERA